MTGQCNHMGERTRTSPADRASEYLGIQRTTRLILVLTYKVEILSGVTLNVKLMGRIRNM